MSEEGECREDKDSNKSRIARYMFSRTGVKNESGDEI